MSRTNQFFLKFIGLKDGSHKFEYDLDNSFFVSHDYSDFNSCDIKVKIELVKKTTVLELHIIGCGLANINCTLSNEPFDFEVNSKMKLLYEMVVLSMPIRNVHPGIEDGSIKSDIINRLKDFDINKEKSSNFDPRWDKLKKLKK